MMIPLQPTPTPPLVAAQPAFPDLVGQDDLDLAELRRGFWQVPENAR
jgi:hypothetical protein